MGRRGPAPEPVEAKLARGETRPSRINARVPKPRLHRPSMPREMDAPAKKVWRRIVREQAFGLIRAVDADLLRCYCEAVSRYEGAVRAYTGPLLVSRGGVVANPLHRITRDDADLIRLLARELGIGPSSRAGMQIVGFGGGERSGSPDEDMERTIGIAPRLRIVGEGNG